MKRDLSDSDSDCDGFDDSIKSGSPSQSCQISDRKRRRGVIEKRRRDRINSSLVELRRLVPSAFEKQGSAKLEKAEILQMTVDHLKMLTQKGLNSYNYDPHTLAKDYRYMGYRECAAEVARYLVAVEGLELQDPLRLRLLSHLQCYTQQREMTSGGGGGGVGVGGGLVKPSVAAGVPFQCGNVWNSAGGAAASHPVMSSFNHPQYNSPVHGAGSMPLAASGHFASGSLGAGSLGSGSLGGVGPGSLQQALSGGGSDLMGPGSMLNAYNSADASHSHSSIRGGGLASDSCVTGGSSSAALSGLTTLHHPSSSTHPTSHHLSHLHPSSSSSSVSSSSSTLPLPAISSSSSSTLGGSTSSSASSSLLHPQFPHPHHHHPHTPQYQSLGVAPSPNLPYVPSASHSMVSQQGPGGALGSLQQMSGGGVKPYRPWGTDTLAY